nr:hypothetical protein [Alicyclobacillus sacchari]
MDLGQQVYPADMATNVEIPTTSVLTMLFQSVMRQPKRTAIVAASGESRMANSVPIYRLLRRRCRLWASVLAIALPSCCPIARST